MLQYVCVVQSSGSSAVSSSGESARAMTKRLEEAEVSAVDI